MNLDIDYDFLIYNNEENKIELSSAENPEILKLSLIHI